MNGQESLDALLNELFPRAIESLKSAGKFYPFAQVITVEDEFASIDADLDDDAPSAQEVVEALTTLLRDGARDGRYRATGLCMDMHITDPRTGEETDAVMAALENEAGENVDVYLPYGANEEGDYEYDEFFAVAGEGTVFSDDPPVE